MKRQLLPLLGALALPASLSAQDAAPVEAPSIMAPVLRISDIDRSVRFYTEGLGMTERGRNELPNAIEIFVGYSSDPSDTGLLLFKRKGDDSAPIDHTEGYLRTILRTPDVDAVSARLAAAGYDAGKKASYGAYRILNVTDPDGYRFEIVQRPEQERADVN